MSKRVQGGEGVCNMCVQKRVAKETQRRSLTNGAQNWLVCFQLDK